MSTFEKLNSIEQSINTDLNELHIKIRDKIKGFIRDELEKYNLSSEVNKMIIEYDVNSDKIKFTVHTSVYAFIASGVFQKQTEELLNAILKDAKQAFINPCEFVY